MSSLRKDNKPDVLIENEGTIVLFRPLTEAGREWLKENTDGQWFGGALVVEHRYASDLAMGLYDAGITIYNA